MKLLKEPLNGDDIFVIRGFCTPKECREFTALSEQAGYGDAPITTATGFEMRKDIRDNARVVLDDPELAARLWKRAKPLLPGRVRDCKVIGFNERFRFYRYDPGQRFAPHFDGSFRRDNGEESQLTFMIYLNDDFTGGETKFYCDDGALRLAVKPEQAMALVFIHDHLHEGAPVRLGCKYVLRTDVMYEGVE